jgi:UrcA family protein
MNIKALVPSAKTALCIASPAAGVVLSKLNTPLVALLALSFLAPTAAVAGDNHVWTTESTRVSLADLDLATLDGVRVARKRIDETARDLCSRLAGPDAAGRHAQYAACMRQAIAMSQQQLAALRRAAASTQVARATETMAR